MIIWQTFLRSAASAKIITIFFQNKQENVIIMSNSFLKTCTYAQMEQMGLQPPDAGRKKRRSTAKGREST